MSLSKVMLTEKVITVWGEDENQKPSTTEHK